MELGRLVVDEIDDEASGTWSEATLETVEDP